MFDDQTPITLADAAALFPTRHGKKVHVKTIRQRITKGVHGVKLNAFKDGLVWYTTARWIREFQEACTRKAMPGGQRSVGQQREMQKMARRILTERFGFHGEKQRKVRQQGPKG